jgi:hypothetical protein
VGKSDKDKLGEETMRRIRAKIDARKKKNPPSEVDPKKNPPAVKGEKNKHVTWGENKNRDPKYRPKHSK